MKQLFTNLGATEKEMETFLKLLELGAQPISVIAKHMHVPRTSMYVTVEKLKQLKLIDQFDRAGVTFVKCIPIKSLKTLLSVQEQKLQETCSLLESAMPELESKEQSLSITPKVQYFEGREGVMKLYESILSQEKEFCGYFNPEAIIHVIGKKYLSLGDLPGIHNTKSRELVVMGPEAEEYKKTYASDIHKIKILPKGVTFDADIIITREKIYMIAINNNEISAIEIWNAQLAKALQAAFDGWWART